MAKRAPNGPADPRSYTWLDDGPDAELRVSGDVLKHIRASGLPCEIIASGRWQGMGRCAAWVAWLASLVAGWRLEGGVLLLRATDPEAEPAALLMSASKFDGAEYEVATVWRVKIDAIVASVTADPSLGAAMATAYSVGKVQALIPFLEVERVRPRGYKAVRS